MKRLILTIYLFLLSAIITYGQGVRISGMTQLRSLNKTNLLVVASTNSPSGPTNYSIGTGDMAASLIGILPAYYYGAVGDGVTDDTVAIQAGLNDGGVLLAANTTYLVSNLTLTRDSILHGLGASSVLKSKAASVGYLLDCGTFQLELDGVSMTGLGYTTNTLGYAPAPTGTSKHGIRFWGVGTPSIRNLWMSGFAGKALDVIGDNVSILQRSNHWSVFNLNSISNYYGIYLESGSAAEYGRIEGGHISYATVGLMMLDANNIVSGNIFLDCNTGMVVNPTDGRAHSLFMGNIFNHMNGCGIYATNVTGEFTFAYNHMMASGTGGTSNSIYVVNSTNVLIRNNVFQLSGDINFSNSIVVLQDNWFFATGAMFPAHTELSYFGGNVEQGYGNCDSLFNTGGSNYISASLTSYGTVVNAPIVNAGTSPARLRPGYQVWMQGPGGNANVVMLSTNDGLCGLYWQSRYPGTNTAWEMLAFPSATSDIMVLAPFINNGNLVTNMFIWYTNGVYQAVAFKATGGASDLSGFPLTNAGPVTASSIAVTNLVSLRTNYVAANFTPVAGTVLFVASNNAVYSVSATKTNLVAAP